MTVVSTDYTGLTNLILLPNTVSNLIPNNIKKDYYKNLMFISELSLNFHQEIC